MKNKIIITLVAIVLIAVAYVFVSGDTENRFARLGVSYFDGDYIITHYGLSGTNAWLVIKGKVTSEADKGYYHTRALVKGGKTAYLQLPMNNTVVEEYVNENQLTAEQKDVLTRKYGKTFFTKK